MDDPGAGELRANASESIEFHISNSPLGVVEWDHEFRVSFWSGRAQDLFGWSGEEVLGSHPDDWRFVHEDDVAAVADIMDELLSGRAPRNVSRNRNYTRDGRILHCEWYNSILTDEQGRLVSVFSLIHDISDRVETEAQLRQLQKMESIGQLTGGIAHDFNNLLTVILGNAGLLAESLAEQPDLQPLAEMVVSAASRGAELTHQLLSFSRQQALEPKVVDVNSSLAGMRDMLGRTLGEQIELTLIQQSSWPAFIDPAQLESSLLNLCLNARDAMPGGGSLTIETEDVTLDDERAAAYADVEPGSYVVIAVSDNGCGIDPEHIEQVIEPFFTTKETGRGTGLGLSMVYGFVKQSRGHITIYSEPGQGTTVRLYLPRGSGQTDSVADTPDWTGSLTGHECILVVEDNSLVRRFAETELTRLGYRVLTAADGPSALAMIEQNADIDLLFTDVVMPGGMNGPHLAERARQIRPDLKVLYTSGYTENAIVHHGRLDAGIRLLSKPYRREMLGRKIREALADS